jgi:hypothetical protein
MEYKMKVIMSVVMAVVFSQGIYAQGKRPLTPEEKKETYKHFLVNTHKLMVQVGAICESRECKALSVHGRKLVRKTVNKGQQGLVGPQELKEFHAALATHLTKVILELNKQESRNRTRKEMFQFPSDGGECDLCSEVYEQAMGICGLDTIVSPGAAGICSAVSSMAYISCLDRWCQNSFFPDWYVNWFYGPEDEGGIDNGGEYIMED